jgi:two-component sensor histidine kinase
MEGRLSILVEATPDSGGAGIGIRWCETGVTPPSADTPSAAGFGSVLIERSLQQIGTTLHRRWEGERYLVDLVIPQ